MLWNWQLKDWPKFTYSAEALKAFEKAFLHEAGMLSGTLKYLKTKELETLKVDLISDEAFKTSAIEGEILDRSSLQSSIKRQFGLKNENKRIPLPEQGISEMMVDLYKTYDSNLQHSQLFNWHKMLTYGRTDLLHIGKYRTHRDAMQIVSGRVDMPSIHFEAPPSAKVRSEMNVFIDWFNSDKETEPLTKAGIAHLYFESIHPFEDGNGRIGRAISEKVLSQSLQRPTLISLSNSIESDRKTYYAALQANSKTLNITDWLIYSCQLILNAQRHSQKVIAFIIEKGNFYRNYVELFNARQHKVVDRIFKEGVSGFKGGLSADNYITITKTTASTATRDLQKLVEMGAFIKIGERKGTRYYLNL